MRSTLACILPFLPLISALPSQSTRTNLPVRLAVRKADASDSATATDQSVNVVNDSSSEFASASTLASVSSFASIATLPSALISTSAPAITSASSIASSSLSATSSVLATASAVGSASTTDSASSTASASAATTPVTSSLAFSPSSATSTAITAPTIPSSSNIPSTFPAVSGNSQIKSASYAHLTGLIPTLLENAKSIVSHSWEFGAYTSTLLEVYYPTLAEYGYDASTISCDGTIPYLALNVTVSALRVANYSWTGAPSTSGGEAVTRPTAIMDGDGALGDPASVGTGVLVLSKYAECPQVQQTFGDSMQASNADYLWVANNQYAYLADSNATSANGTISQREGSFEMWSDAGFMISPFIGYFGLSTSNTTLLTSAITQWSLDSSALFDTTQNMFRHINPTDEGFWCTGNGWMAMGLMRVLNAVQAAGQAGTMWDEVNELECQIANVFLALLDQADSSNLIPDYMQVTNATLSLGDTAGSALIVAAYYRMLVLAPGQAELWSELDKAEAIFDSVVAHITDDGWLTQVVDPLGTNGWIVGGINSTEFRSPEGQSFLAMMWAARTAAGV